MIGGTLQSKFKRPAQLRGVFVGAATEKKKVSGTFSLPLTNDDERQTLADKPPVAPRAQ
ncbi:MAG: hypothetical protein AB7U76_13045 [Pirellulales bacterium]